MARILVVEDDPIVSQAYSIVLKAEGFEVDAADSAEEGLKLARHHRPDLILLDILLPRMSGIQFLKQYKQVLDGAVPEVIVMTNLASDESMREATQLGVERYLTKSNYTMKQIVNMVKEVLAGKEND